MEMEKRIENIQDLKKGQKIIFTHQVYGTVYGYYLYIIDRVYKNKAVTTCKRNIRYSDTIYQSTEKNIEYLENFRLEQKITDFLISFKFRNLSFEKKKEIFAIIDEV